MKKVASKIKSLFDAGSIYSMACAAAIIYTAFAVYLYQCLVVRASELQQGVMRRPLTSQYHAACHSMIRIHPTDLSRFPFDAPHFLCHD